MSYELGVIGAGNMAEALVRGLIDQHLIEAADMLVSDPAEARREVFAQLGVEVIDDNARVIAESKLILLAVKPQILDKVADDLAAVDPAKQMLMSILAGIGTAKLEGMMSPGARVIRVMPNTPLLVGMGMSAIAPGSAATDDDTSRALEIFSAAGQAVVVAESLMDAVTAVSGSGPAYVYYLAEAMMSAAEELGMTENQARRFVNQTILGAATLLNDAPDTAAELRRKVTSPGGTTKAALDCMEAHHVKQSIADGVKCAADRSAELGR